MWSVAVMLDNFIRFLDNLIGAAMLWLVHQLVTLNFYIPKYAVIGLAGGGGDCPIFSGRVSYCRRIFSVEMEALP